MVMSASRQVLLDQPSVSLRLNQLQYFSQRALLIGASSIHGCGLFTLIDLVQDQMVIEYTGEVVRPCLTDKRERNNERKVSRRQISTGARRDNAVVLVFRALAVTCSPWIR